MARKDAKMVAPADMWTEDIAPDEEPRSPALAAPTMVAADPDEEVVASTAPAVG